MALLNFGQSFFFSLVLSLLSTAGDVNVQQFTSTQHDYIVVGGGTAGLALAVLLSNDPTVNVGVIEAGLHAENNNILVPGLIGSLVGNPDFDWGFSTVPQTNVANRQLILGRGKVLGGTSALNYLARIQTSRHELDGWETLQNPGWNFSTIQSFVKQAETWTPPPPNIASTFHAPTDSQNLGRKGPIHTTSYSVYGDPVVPFFKTMNSLGIPTLTAPNGGTTVGAWTITCLMDAKNKTRSYATNAYYEPVASRPNLQVLTGAQATKILTIKGSNGLVKATGVQFTTRDGLRHIVNAKFEIVLSTGAVGTPQLLELSGIGSATLLQQFGIPSVIDLPGVGENLQDHPGVGASFRTFDNATTFDILNDPILGPEQFALYVKNRTGLFSGTASTVAFLPLDKFLPNSKIKTLKSNLDRGIAVNPAQFNQPKFKLQRSWIEDDTIPQLELILFPVLALSPATPIPGQRYYTFNVVVQHAWNRGSVHITSSNPTVAPAIDPRYLQGPSDYDLQLLLEGLKYVRKVATTGALGAVTLSQISPAANASDAELVQYILQNLGSNFHLTGTAAMLPRSENGVVDRDLKVYGTSNLRVVDASIFPLQLSGHPTIDLYGIAEKMAQEILASHKQTP